MQVSPEVLTYPDLAGLGAPAPYLAAKAPGGEPSRLEKALPLWIGATCRQGIR